VGDDQGKKTSGSPPMGQY